MKPNRLAGHSLWYEGRAYDFTGRPLDVYTRTGRAKCTCGWLSKELPSRYARKAAHRKHKDDVRAMLEAGL